MHLESNEAKMIIHSKPMRTKNNHIFNKLKYNNLIKYIKSSRHNFLSSETEQDRLGGTQMGKQVKKDNGKDTSAKNTENFKSGLELIRLHPIFSQLYAHTYGVTITKSSKKKQECANVSEDARIKVNINQELTPPSGLGYSRTVSCTLLLGILKPMKR
jgi:hypothetical protein